MSSKQLGFIVQTVACAGGLGAGLWEEDVNEQENGKAGDRAVWEIIFSRQVSDQQKQQKWEGWHRHAWEHKRIVILQETTRGH